MSILGLDPPAPELVQPATITPIEQALIDASKLSNDIHVVAFADGLHVSAYKDEEWISVKDFPAEQSAKLVNDLIAVLKLPDQITKIVAINRRVYIAGLQMPLWVTHAIAIPNGKNFLPEFWIRLD